MPVPSPNSWGATTQTPAQKKNPYPNHPDAKFVNGKWQIPPGSKVKVKGAPTGIVGPQGLTKAGKSAFQKWLSANGGAKPGAGLDFDPTAGWPTPPGLTTYPGLDASTLPDGSEVPDTPAHAFARTRASLLDPKQFAKLEGSAAYQPIIDALGGQQSRLQGGIGSANQMMDKAYGDAADASYRGAQAVTNSNAQANQSLTDLAARLAQVAGGDPTAAAAVGQASANQQTDNTRFANVAAQGQADQAAAANRDLATQKLAYKGVTDKAIADLATQKGQAQTQGSQAQGKAIEEALGFNSDQRTAALNRDVASQEAWLAGQIAGPQITAANLTNLRTRSGMALDKHSAQVNDWTSINQSKRQHYLDVVGNITDKATAAKLKSEMIKGNTPVAELALADDSVYQGGIAQVLDQTFRTKTGPVQDPGATYNAVRDQLHTAYPDSGSKVIKALALRYVQSQIPNWNAQHGNKYKIVKGVPQKIK